MAALTLLDSFPPLVRAFVRIAQSAGLECREGDREDNEGRPLLSLHGTDSQFRQLPEMARHALPKLRRVHWWLPLGIVGTLYREGDAVAAVIDWTRYPSPRSRHIRDWAAEARTDTAFQSFMRRTMEPVETEPPATA